MSRRTKALGPDIARRLRLAREASGLTVRELAERAHTTTTTLTNIVNAHGANSSVGLMADLARALKVDPAWLVYGTGKGPGPGEKKEDGED